MNRALCSALVGLVFLSIVSRAGESNRWEVIRDIEYARAGEQRLNLDLHIPRGKPRPPLIVWVHGGAWRSGSKTNMPLGKLVEDGYAVASVDYRLSTHWDFCLSQLTSRAMFLAEVNTQIPIGAFGADTVRRGIYRLCSMPLLLAACHFIGAQQPAAGSSPAAGSPLTAVVNN